VSLGNLYSDMGRHHEALDHLRKAEHIYREGSGHEHPKVAWALEGQARVLIELKREAEAGEHLKDAINIRNALQEQADGKELFSKELNDARVPPPRRPAESARTITPSRPGTGRLRVTWLGCGRRWSATSSSGRARESAPPLVTVPPTRSASATPPGTPDDRTTASPTVPARAAAAF